MKIFKKGLSTKKSKNYELNCNGFEELTVEELMEIGDAPSSKIGDSAAIVMFKAVEPYKEQKQILK